MHFGFTGKRITITTIRRQLPETGLSLLGLQLDDNYRRSEKSLFQYPT
jgi:hypothetical protein